MRPFTSTIELTSETLTPHGNRIERRLSALKGQFYDEQAYSSLLAKDDKLLYEVYENRVPEKEGELLHGLSIVHPGKVGDEYNMTKGHFHAVLDTAEVYYVLKGQGYMMMEIPEGEWSAEELRPGVVLYVPPRWAHRSINTGDEDLVFLFVYPANAGHDYKTIETKGFRKLIVERDGKPQIIDNLKWR